MIKKKLWLFCILVFKCNYRKKMSCTLAISHIRCKCSIFFVYFIFITYIFVNYIENYNDQSIHVFFLYLFAAECEICAEIIITWIKTAFRDLHFKNYRYFAKFQKLQTFWITWILDKISKNFKFHKWKIKTIHKQDFILLLNWS